MTGPALNPRSLGESCGDQKHVIGYHMLCLLHCFAILLVLRGWVQRR